jgi:iron-sulfur cluster repair protein YtfE (RIC family)
MVKKAALADSRDMIGAHDAFRREFGALPALIRGVAPSDKRRAVVVAEHAELLVTLLHGHHTSEDDFVWPKLSTRCPDDLYGIVETMEAQHRMIDAALQDLVAAARRWSATADAADREDLADRADRLLTPLNEHLTLEEEQILPLIDQYLTDREWKQTVAASAEKVPVRRRPVMLGMILHTANDEMLTLLRDAAPRLLWLIVKPLSGRAYRVYAERVYGGAAPLR